MRNDDARLFSIVCGKETNGGAGTRAHCNPRVYGEAFRAGQYQRAPRYYRELNEQTADSRGETDNDNEDDNDKRPSNYTALRRIFDPVISPCVSLREARRRTARPAFSRRSAKQPGVSAKTQGKEASSRRSCTLHSRKENISLKFIIKN